MPGRPVDVKLRRLDRKVSEGNENLAPRRDRLEASKREAIAEALERKRRLDEIGKELAETQRRLDALGGDEA